MNRHPHSMTKVGQSPFATMKSIFIVSLAFIFSLAAARASPTALSSGPTRYNPFGPRPPARNPLLPPPTHPNPFPSVTAPCETERNKCSRSAGKLVAGIVRPLDACKPFRRCKRTCRKEKRSDRRACRRNKRSCRRQCRRHRRRRDRRRCRRGCRRTKRRCKRSARRTKRACKRECKTTYKTRECRKARRGIFTSGLKAVPACWNFYQCSRN